ncbi:UDP-N-acetylmuramoyl-tripeptide--D-alanyl-D-alanine ligase [Chitinasiproducens palmae]|uniref:UDP-N-acetylmuramoyl-tripeptide--D-alanyl-D-alanine ligase n=1 Tax=Chitinasiproducens palmae TaxID=1770053 RepID=A0A1H2PRN7_9BURK|nr:UDP-N-acetylmuramoyl-tripeptide--D-alanyl-D-alanine ligase [Chitinasiproducens palmae]SDV49594.1 UDP-N-acetylmuramoyl-tripeptide--D-alanyl-D-alanine ligase [Chitinasiproducens palmae]
MSMTTLARAAALIGEATVLGDETVEFARVVTDSRQAGPGDLFVALRGERFDAHGFVAAVGAQGAAAALVDAQGGAVAPLQQVHEETGLPLLRTADTRLALGALAAGWRRGFTLPVVAVTGSNGKTTVKEMIAAIFAAAVGKSRRLATAGNLNNDIGVPLTLLRLDATHQLAVIELGMNHPGETAVLARMCAPTVALINNAQREHQEFMASVAAVADEHAAALSALADDGVAVFPAFDPFSAVWHRAAGARRVLTFALDDDLGDAEAMAQRAADVVGRLDANGELTVTCAEGRFIVTLAIPGRHNARNALAATACALGAGVTLDAIGAGLAAFQPVSGRLQRLLARCERLAGATVIDDSYNANPDSVRAAIDVLAEAVRPRVLVLGDMGEVGEHGEAFHREVGAYARERGLDALFVLGPQTQASWQAFAGAAPARGGHFASHEALFEALGETYGGEATILVKGSRYMKMERVVDALTLRDASRGH